MTSAEQIETAAVTCESNCPIVEQLNGKCQKQSEDLQKMQSDSDSNAAERAALSTSIRGIKLGAEALIKACTEPETMQALEGYTMHTCKSPERSATIVYWGVEA